jgi:hypothetical protein
MVRELSKILCSLDSNANDFSYNIIYGENKKRPKSKITAQTTKKVQTSPEKLDPHHIFAIFYILLIPFPPF